MAHPYLEQLQSLVSTELRGDGDLTCKHFFSGTALYANGRICASLSPAGLAFKLGNKRSEEATSSSICAYFSESIQHSLI